MSNQYLNYYYKNPIKLTLADLPTDELVSLQKNFSEVYYLVDDGFGNKSTRTTQTDNITINFKHRYAVILIEKETEIYYGNVDERVGYSYDGYEKVKL